jgi:hypothetical protein
VYHKERLRASFGLGTLGIDETGWSVGVDAGVRCRGASSVLPPLARGGATGQAHRFSGGERLRRSWRSISKVRNGQLENETGFLKRTGSDSVRDLISPFST